MIFAGKALAGALALLLSAGCLTAEARRSQGNVSMASEHRHETGGRQREASLEGTGTPGQDAAEDAEETGRLDSSRDARAGIMRKWDVTSTDTGGTLLFSDSPEYVSEDGILYADTVSGDARILYYHLNNSHAAKKVAVVLENAYDGPNEVKVTRGGMGRPSGDYLGVGKSTQMEYFGRSLHDTIRMEKGAKRLLQPGMDRTVLQPAQLVYGVYDFSSEHPVKVSVIMYPAAADPVEFLAHAKVLPKDGHCLRGTFPGMNRILRGARAYNPERDGIVYILIGDDVNDRYRTGIDATDGSRATNVGNYGILYSIQLPTVGTGKTRYLLSPLGGVYAGAMAVRQNAGRARLLPTPRGRIFFGDATPPEPDHVTEARTNGIALLADYMELADLGAYRNTSHLAFEYSPPGASNLPVTIILMPAGKK